MELLLWWLFCVGMGLSASLLVPHARGFGQRVSFLGALRAIARERQALQRAIALIQGLEETLISGALPTADLWQELEAQPGDWGATFAACLREARAAGLPVLPTLKRFRQLLTRQDESLVMARARCSQAIGQTLSCAVLVPVFALALAVLLPGIAESRATWTVACVFALALTALGAGWIFKSVDEA